MTGTCQLGPPPLAVNSVTPNSGPLTGNTSVTIKGAGFTGATAVYFGTVLATGFVVNSDYAITVPSPPSVTPGAVDVTVLVNGGTSPTSQADLFTYT